MEMMASTNSTTFELSFNTIRSHDPSPIAGLQQDHEPFGRATAARSFVRNGNPTSFPSYFRGNVRNRGRQEQQQQNQQQKRRGRGRGRVPPYVFSKQCHRPEPAFSTASPDGGRTSIVDATSYQRAVQAGPSSQCIEAPNTLGTWKRKTWERRFARKDPYCTQERRSDVSSRARFSSTRLPKLRDLKESAKKVLSLRSPTVSRKKAATATGPANDKIARTAAAVKLQACFRRYRDLKREQEGLQQEKPADAGTEGAAAPRPRTALHRPDQSRYSLGLPHVHPPGPTAGARRARLPPPTERMERQYSEITMSDWGGSRDSSHSLTTHGSTCSLSHSAATPSLPQQRRRDPATATPPSTLVKHRSRRWKAVVHHNTKHHDREEPLSGPRTSVSDLNVTVSSSFDSVDETYRALGGEEGGEDDTIVMMPEEDFSISVVDNHDEKTDAEYDDRSDSEDSPPAKSESANTPDLSPKVMLLRRQLAVSSGAILGASPLESLIPARPAMMRDPRSPATNHRDREGHDDRSLTHEVRGVKDRFMSRENIRQQGLDGGSSGAVSTGNVVSNSERTHRVTDDVRITASSGHSSFSSYIEASTVAGATEDFGSGINRSKGIKIDSPVKRPQRRLSPAMSNTSFGSESGTSQQFSGSFAHRNPSIPDVHHHGDDEDPYLLDKQGPKGRVGVNHQDIDKPPLTPALRQLPPVLLSSSSSRWEHDSSAKGASPRQSQLLRSSSRDKLTSVHDSFRWKSSDELTTKQDGQAGHGIKSRRSGGQSLMFEDSPARIPPRKLSPYPLIFNSASVDTSFDGIRRFASTVGPVVGGGEESCPTKAPLRVPQRRLSRPHPSHAEVEDRTDAYSQRGPADAALSEPRMVSDAGLHQDVVNVPSTASPLSIRPIFRPTEHTKNPHPFNRRVSSDIYLDPIDFDNTESANNRSRVNSNACDLVDGVTLCSHAEKESPRSVASLNQICGWECTQLQRPQLHLDVDGSSTGGSGSIKHSRKGDSGTTNSDLYVKRTR